MINFTRCTEQHNTELSSWLLNEPPCGQLAAGTSPSEMAELWAEWVVSPTAEFTWRFLWLNSCFYFAKKFAKLDCFRLRILCRVCAEAKLWKLQRDGFTRQSTSVILSSSLMATVKKLSRGASAQHFVFFLPSRVSLHAFIPDSCTDGCISSCMCPPCH